MKRTCAKCYFLLLLACMGMFISRASALYAQVGTVWAWGYNADGELGNGRDHEQRTTPVQVSNLTGVVQMSAGGSHALALYADGTVWAWGVGSLGVPGTGASTIPIVIPNLKAVQVSAGADHSLSLRSDGTVWAWGINARGQLGDGTTTRRYTPTQVAYLTNAVQVSAGDSHSLALKSDGTVSAWGWNPSGQLGDGTTVERDFFVRVSGLKGVIQVSAGSGYSLALKSDGTVWGWGANGVGQLGDGTTDDRRIPVQVSGLTGVTQVVAGSSYSLALKSDGTVWAWGKNASGELGDGTNIQRTIPVQVSELSGVVEISCSRATSGHCLAVKSDGTVWSWGYNWYGQLGIGTADVGSNVPIQVLGLTNQTGISAGGQYGESFALQAAALNVKLSPTNLILGYGAPVTLSATLKNALGALLINEPLTFSLDGNLIGTANTDASGKASLKVSNPLLLNLGVHSITVAFAGDRLNRLSTKKATLYITPADTTITIGTFAGSPGNTKSLIALLTRDTDGAKLINQPLTFKVDGNAIGAATTDGKGKATLLYKFDEAYSVGVHTLTSEFAGDSNHNASDGTGNLNVAQAATRLSASSLSGKAGATVALKAKLTRTTDSALLGGKTIRFQIDGADVGSATTSAGVATLSYRIPAALAAGAHKITALFDGDAFYLNVGDDSKILTVK